MVSGGLSLTGVYALLQQITAHLLSFSISHRQLVCMVVRLGSGLTMV